MLEAGVQMIFQAKTHYVMEMAVINMSVYSEQSLEYYFDNALEILREKDFNFCWEVSFIT